MKARADLIANEADAAIEAQVDEMGPVELWTPAGEAEQNVTLES